MLAFVLCLILTFTGKFIAAQQSDECFKACIVNPILELKRLRDDNKFHQKDYIEWIPKCMHKIGTNQPYSEINNPTKEDKTTCPKNKWKNLKKNAAYPHLRKLFSCLNKKHKETDQGSLNNPGTTIIVWSGKIARKKADEISRQIPKIVMAKTLMQRMSKYIVVSGARDPNPTRSLAFSSLKTLTSGFDYASKAQEKALPQATAWKIADITGDLFSLWIVSYADWKYPVQQYSSIDFVFGPNDNPGKKSLLDKGIRFGLMINSVFWNTEMITLFRNAKNKLSLHTPKLYINMLVYDEHGKPVENGGPGKHEWKTVDLFGSVDELKNIPIFFRPISVKNDERNFRFYTGDQMYLPGVNNLLELMKFYNTKVTTGLRLKVLNNEKFFDNTVSNLCKFVYWTMELKPDASISAHVNDYYDIYDEYIDIYNNKETDEYHDFEGDIDYGCYECD